MKLRPRHISRHYMDLTDRVFRRTLKRHRDTEAAKIFLIRLMGEDDVPEVIHTDQLRSYGAAIRKIPSLVNVDHQQVISTARCNNIIEQRASVASRAVLPKTIPPSYTASGTTASQRPHGALFCSRQQQGFKREKRAQEFLNLHARIGNLHHQIRTSVSDSIRRSGQASSRASVQPKKQPKTSVPDVINGRCRGGLRFRPPLTSLCRDAT
jgi:hypothetical protein